MPPTILNLTAVRGDTFARTVTAYDSAGAALNLTGATVWFTVKDARDQQSDDSAAITRCYWVSGGASSGITVPTPSNGGITIKAPASDMAALVPGGAYVYDVQVLLNNESYTIVQGDLAVERDVTIRQTTP